MFIVKYLINKFSTKNKNKVINDIENNYDDVDS
jgi:hypothetical protein